MPEAPPDDRRSAAGDAAQPEPHNAGGSPGETSQNTFEDTPRKDAAEPEPHNAKGGAEEPARVPSRTRRAGMPRDPNRTTREAEVQLGEIGEIDYSGKHQGSALKQIRDPH